MTEIYSNKEPLQCCEFPNLRRAVGVEVNRYSTHMSVDLERASVSVNTASFGKNVPFEEVEAKVIESTEWVVSHLDKVIAELQEHRARLVNELTSIRASGKSKRFMICSKTTESATTECQSKSTGKAVGMKPAGLQTKSRKFF